MKIISGLLIHVALLLLLTNCSLLRPAGSGYGNEDNINNRDIKALLTPNDPNLPYPIYANFSEISALFDQRDGKTYVINFWATWCRPCIAEMPYFERLAAENPAVQVIMVSLDKPGDVRTKMKQFVEDRPLRLPVISLTDGDYGSWTSRVDRSWSRATIPVTFFQRDGRKQFNKGAISSYAELQGLVRGL